MATQWVSCDFNGFEIFFDVIPVGFEESKLSMDFQLFDGIQRVSCVLRFSKTVCYNASTIPMDSPTSTKFTCTCVSMYAIPLHTHTQDCRSVCWREGMPFSRAFFGCIADK